MSYAAPNRVSMEQDILTRVFIPASLAIIMFGMGLSLEVADFRRLMRSPRAVATGLVAQMILVPVIGFLVVALLSPRPVLAAGVMIIAFCPGGAVSNLIAHLACGNTALSVTLTAVSSVLAVLTIPHLVNAALAWQLGRATPFELPLLATTAQLASITIVPIVAGMTIRRVARKFAERSETAVKVLSGLFLFLVIVAAIGQNVESLPRYLAEIGPALLLLNVLVIGAGFASAHFAGLDLRDRLTISIEAGVQNGALGIAIPATFVGNAEMAIPPAIYGVLMILSSSVFILIGNRRQYHRDMG